MVDVLDCISQLSSLFQKEDITLTRAKDGMQRTVVELTAMLARPGTHLQECLGAIGDGNEYQGVTIKRGANDLAQFNDASKPRIINCIIRYLEQRFQSIQGADPTLQAMCVFDTSLWPDDRATLATYGEDKIRIIVDHFRLLLEKNNFDFAAVYGEWSGLKVCIANNYFHLTSKALWKRVFIHYSDRFPNVLMLVHILLILPLSTACCERGFSVMGKVKSDWRSCLSVKILDCLMRINIEGPSVAEYDSQHGLQLWWARGTRTRCPNYND